MPPKLVSDDGKHMVIRPMAFCRERDIEKYAEIKQFPIIPCDLCGSQPNLQRKVIKDMLRSWDKQFPGRTDVMFKALRDVVPSHLADTKLYDFKTIQTQDTPFEDGDLAFDEDCGVSDLASFKAPGSLNPLHPQAIPAELVAGVLPRS
jgi:tRNA 2-thiocytidine biosynthesis protein TtcA